MGKSRRRASLAPEFVLLFTLPLLFFSVVLFIILDAQRPREYKFEKKIEQIESIEIVEILDGSGKTIRLVEEIEPEKWDTFWFEFKKVTCRIIALDPAEWLDKIGICVTYEDDSYEILTESSCAYFSSEEDSYAQFNRYHFDQEQFYSFLSTYAEDYLFPAK